MSETTLNDERPPRHITSMPDPETLRTPFQVLAWAIYRAKVEKPISRNATNTEWAYIIEQYITECGWALVKAGDESN